MLLEVLLKTLPAVTGCHLHDSSCVCVCVCVLETACTCVVCTFYCPVQGHCVQPIRHPLQDAAALAVTIVQLACTCNKGRKQADGLGAAPIQTCKLGNTAVAAGNDSARPRCCAFGNNVPGCDTTSPHG